MRALEADALLFLTDVSGLLSAHGARIARVTAEECARLEREGVLTDGMLPKVEAALAAARAAPDAVVKIAPAAGPEALLEALDPAVGTHFDGSQPALESEGGARWTST